MNNVLQGTGYLNGCNKTKLFGEKRTDNASIGPPAPEKFQAFYDIFKNRLPCHLFLVIILQFYM